MGRASVRDLPGLRPAPRDRPPRAAVRAAGTGHGPAAVRGGENEFQRLRPYVPGDPYRHIDWKATARRREYVTREFGQDRTRT